MSSGKITWIVGNGFDINLGLRTGYQDFLKNYYSVRATRENFEDLKRAAQEIDEAMWNSDNWGDLEVLLGQVVEWYDSRGKLEQFHDTFEEMTALLLEYADTQIDRFVPGEMIDEADLREFWESVTQFHLRLTHVDQKKLEPYPNFAYSLEYNFVSLNYTTPFDNYFELAVGNYEPFAKRLVSGHARVDSAGDILHIHGRNHDEGEVVFGVSDDYQISNGVPPSDEAVFDMWVKGRKNIVYGNDKTEVFERLISSSKIICIYGCSIGSSDKYLWEQICTKLKNDSDARVIIFTYQLPNRKGPEARQFLRKRAEVLARFCKLGGIPESDVPTIEDQIIVESSACIFNLNPDLNEYSGRGLI
ncbi:MAG: bacteriophage abortive infection AbiH family protein [Coriobacteriia bacterium]|nr:bacteriophage abortive infection AbiH family protein [Coriobacteriia bacterium]